MPVPEMESWLSMFLECFTDSTVIVLMVAAGVSLSVGLYEDLATGWIEGKIKKNALSLIKGISKIYPRLLNNF